MVMLLLTEDREHRWGDAKIQVRDIKKASLFLCALCSSVVTFNSGLQFLPHFIFLIPSYCLFFLCILSSSWASNFHMHSIFVLR